MTSRTSLLVSYLVVSAFNGMSVSGLTVSIRSEDGSEKGSMEWIGTSSAARLAGAYAQVPSRRYTDLLAEQVDAVAASSVLRREESQSPAESNSPFLRNLPWIAIGGAILIVFIVSALVIWFRRRDYQGIEEPAPEPMREVDASSSTRTGSMRVLRMTQGRVTPSRQDTLESADYKEVMKRKLEAGDLMPSRRPQSSVAATSPIQNAVPSALATSPPLLTEVPKLPPPGPPMARSRPLPTPGLAFGSPQVVSSVRSSPSQAVPSTVTPPSRAMTKTPPIPKITVPDDKPLPNPYTMRDSRTGSVILATPADDHFMSNPYVDSMDGHSPARADTPEPFGPVGPVQPLRVAKKNSAGFDSTARSSTFDMGLTSRNSNLYALPVLDISHESLALSMGSKTGPSSQNVPRVERR